MATLHEKFRAPDMAEPPLTTLPPDSSPSGITTPQKSQSAPLQLATPAATRPIFRCGRCAGIIADVGLGHGLRCLHCGHFLTIPSHVHVPCTRCGNSQRVHVRRGPPERCCSVCGHAIIVGDLTLPSRHRHRHHHHGHAGCGHGDAAWAVVVIAVTLLIALLGLTL